MCACACACVPTPVRALVPSDPNGLPSEACAPHRRGEVNDDPWMPRGANDQARPLAPLSALTLTLAWPWPWPSPLPLTSVVPSLACKRPSPIPHPCIPHTQAPPAHQMIAWVEAFLKELNLRLDKDQDVSYHSP